MMHAMNEKALNISIAGMRVTLRLDELDAPDRAQILEHYAAFTDAKLPAAISIHLHVEPGPAFIPLPTGQVYQIHTANRDGRIAFESHFETGSIDLTSGQGSLVMRPGGRPENFLRVLYAWLCLEQRALLLHAAGVVRAGQGYVFFGHSGSGKTTISHLSLEHTILSDDLVILKTHADAVRVYGVPFRGDLLQAPRTNASAELRGLYTLVKADVPRITPVPPVEAIARLSECVPFIMTEPHNAARVLETCAAIQARVPVQTLFFRRAADFWSVIDGRE